MKQLIEVPARFLKPDDLVFDFKYRDLQKVEYVSFETANGGADYFQFFDQDKYELVGKYTFELVVNAE